jgi:hypothetical protein
MNHESVVAEAEVLPRNLFVGTEKIHEKHQDDRPPARRLNSRPAEKEMLYRGN